MKEVPRLLVTPDRLRESKANKGNIEITCRSDRVRRPVIGARIMVFVPRGPEEERTYISKGTARVIAVDRDSVPGVFRVTVKYWGERVQYPSE